MKPEWKRWEVHITFSCENLKEPDKLEDSVVQENVKDIKLYRKGVLYDNIHC
jgi:hypothetical protein